MSTMLRRAVCAACNVVMSAGKRSCPDLICDLITHRLVAVTIHYIYKYNIGSSKTDKFANSAASVAPPPGPPVLAGCL